MLIFLDLGFLLLAEKDFSRWLRRTRGRDAWSPFLEENLTQLWADFKGSWCSPRLKCIVHGNTNVNETTIYIHLLQALKLLWWKLALFFHIFHRAICHWKLLQIPNYEQISPFHSRLYCVWSLNRRVGWFFFYFIPELLVPVHFLKCEMRSWSQIRLGAKMEIASKLRDNIWEFSWRRTGMKS